MQAPSRVGVPEAEADASGASGDVEGDGTEPKKLSKELERAGKRLERMEEANSPGRTLDKPGSRMAAPNARYSIPERLDDVQNGRRVHPNTWGRGPGPPGPREDQIEEDDNGGDWERGNASYSTGKGAGWLAKRAASDSTRNESASCKAHESAWMPQAQDQAPTQVIHSVP